MLKDNPLVSILIVNWNGKKHLEICLSSLSKITYKNVEILVVDQGSVDGSVKYLEDNHKNINVIKLDKNVGFAAGSNVGFKHAKGDFVLFLNNDTRVKQDFLEPLVYAMSDPKVAVVQPKICFWNKKYIQSAGSFLTLTGFLYHRGYGADINKYNVKDEIFSVNGACMLVRTKVAHKLGIFDEDYFAYFEETDFCWRTIISGYKVIYEPKSVIFHKGGQTSKVFVNSHIQYLSFRNRINTYLKNMSVGYLLFMLPLHLFFCMVNIFAFLYKKKPLHAVAIIKAIGSNIINYKIILKKRRVVQSKREIKDKNIFSKYLKNPKFKYYYFLFGDLTRYEKNPKT